MKQKKEKKKIVKIIISVLIAIGIYFFGYVTGHENLKFEKNLKPTLVNRELYKPRQVDFSFFWDIWNQVTSKYVGSVDTQKMTEGAIKGMVDAVGDPYTVFMNAEESKNYAEGLSGQFSGIGAQLDQKDGQIIVVAPLAGTPAEKADLKPKDIILKINDVSTDKMSIDEAISKIRGPEGTSVKLSILREGWSEPKDFTIERAKITVKSVNWEMRDDNIAYISINQFGDDTTDLMKQVAKEIVDKKPKAIILDLRSNPGGYLSSAVDVSSLFSKKGSIVVKERYKDNHIDEQYTTLDPVLGDLKVFVLTNGGTASAAEIIAGALKDLNGAVLIGEKTFGKGVVQELEELKGGATLKVTIAEWLTPNGQTINKEGLKPDIEVGLNEDDAKAGRDPQLDRALVEAGKVQ